MATSYTALLGLALPVTGELQGTWGDTVNNQLTSLVDSAVAGTTTISTDADVTLSTTTGAANQARQAIILWTANGSTTRNITAPAQSKSYVVINASAGTQSIVIRGVGPTTGVTVAKGEKAVVAWDGSDFVRVSAYGGTGEFTTVDTTNLEVTNIKAKDGTASATIADATGVVSFSANPVLSAGTANGVLYLDGSKVVTSGSALVFDGSNLGIGTSSPTEKLTVNQGNIYALRTGGAKLRLLDQNNEVSVESSPVGGASNMLFRTSSLTQMTLDQSGNLGLGVTPSAWGATFVALQVTSGGSSLWSDGLQRLFLSANLYYDGTNRRYQTTGVATEYVQNGGAHQWFTAPSGTAGDPISFTQAMTLDASGNLGIGTTLPSSKLDVNNGYIIAGTAASVNGSKILGGYYTSGNLATFGGEFSNGGPVIGYGVWPSTSAAGAFVSATTINVQRGAYSILGANHIWYGGDVQTVAIDSAVTTTERMRLDSSGNLGLGVTPSAWLGAGYIDFPGNGYIGNASAYSSNTLSTGLNAYYATGAWRYKASSLAATRFDHSNGTFQWYTAPSGTAGDPISFTQAMTLDGSGNLALQDDKQYFWGIGRTAIQGTSASDTMQFFTASLERARITSSGELLVGTTTLAGAGGVSFQSQGGGTGFAIVNNNNAGATGYVFSSYRRSSVEIGSITQNGTTAVLYNTTSDRRLKDNITPAPSASAVIDAIQIVSHGWKSAPNEHVTYGVIAQDLHAVAPQAVSVGDDGDEIEKTWGVDYSKLVPMLIKEIQSLRARVAALESN